MNLAPLTRITAMTAMTLSLAACGGGSTQQDSDRSAAGDQQIERDTTFTAADVNFLQGMIPHHMQAVRMAEMVPDRAESADLRQLADEILESQTEEISLMRNLLGEFGAEPPAMHGAPGGHGSGPAGTPGGGVPGDGPMHGAGSHADGDMEHEGMLSPDEMRELMQSEGRAFDLLWTERMILHHEGAISSAESVLDAGRHPDVAALARDVIAEQKSEIDRMRDMRSAWQSEGATS